MIWWADDTYDTYTYSYFFQKSLTYDNCKFSSLFLSEIPRVKYEKCNPIRAKYWYISFVVLKIALNIFYDRSHKMLTLFIDRLHPDGMVIKRQDLYQIICYVYHSFKAKTVTLYLLGRCTPVAMVDAFTYYCISLLFINLSWLGVLLYFFFSVSITG